MTLEQQLQHLIDQAPPDSNLPHMIARVIGPVIHNVAQDLPALNYYVYQSKQGQWLVSTLGHRDNPQVTKTVVYAYENLTLAPVQQLYTQPQPLEAMSYGIADLLFQLLATPTVESLILVSAADIRKKHPEIKRDDLQQAIQAQLEKYRTRQSPSQWA